MQAFVPGDQFVREGQPLHESALLEPENRAEGAAEEHTLDCSECDQAHSEPVAVVDVLEGPVGLLADAGEVVHCVEQFCLLSVVLNLRVDQQGLGLRVDVLHRDLEALECPCLCDFDFLGELAGQVFDDDPVARSEEGQDHLDELLFVGVEFLPVGVVVGEVDLVVGPEGGHVLLLHHVHVGLADGEQHEAVRFLLQDRFQRVRVRASWMSVRVWEGVGGECVELAVGGEFGLGLHHQVGKLLDFIRIGVH